MNTFLLVLIALKAACLAVCWRGILIAKKRSAANKAAEGSQEEIQALQKRMSQLLEQNQQLNQEMNSLKGSKSEIG